MQKIKVFYLENCPHCRKAFSIIDELKAKNPKYSQIDIEYIEESVHVQIANAHDYYLVPTFYVNGVKMHEGVPTVEKIQNVLDTALK